MTSVLLIYPFFRGARDRSRFRFPPLGVAYIAASLRAAGHAVQLLDCTFLGKDEALARALAAQADVVGISCLATMTEDCLWFADRLHDECELLVVGGPMPTCDPGAFIDHFDLVVRGEGEQAMLEILSAHEAGADPAAVAGVVGGRRARSRATGAAGVASAAAVAFSPPRQHTKDLDELPFPARDLFPNEHYIACGQSRYGFSVTTVMSARGCPHRCEFCSNVVFGGSFRERSPQNVLDEVEEALALGYDRISFVDDVFTQNRRRVTAICAEIERRELRFAWECLAHVDGFDAALAQELKRAGCTRIFFGIESGDDAILSLMNKQITAAQARDAVVAAHQAGLEVGAFFILYYPGETDDTVLTTLRFAGSLPLDYIGLTMPYPLPGTALAARVADRHTRAWHQEGGLLIDHVLTFEADFSQFKMRFAIVKGHVQFEIRKRLGRMAPVALWLFEKPTDALLRLLR